MSSLSTLPKGDSAWLLRKAIERIIQQVSVLETNIGASTTGNSSNTQVIFNDNGTLRGDPDLTFNTALNRLTATNLESTAALTVGTTATITGNLTVDTNVLKVDTTNNRVGIGTASPSVALDVVGASAISGTVSVGTTTPLATGSGRGNVTVNGSTDAILAFGIAGVNSGFVLQDSAGMTLLSSGATYLRCYTNGSERYKIDSTGVATWSNVGGVAGTAMTLNSTGLGVGVVPAAGDGSGAFKAAGTGSLTANSRVGLDVRELVSGNQAGIILGAMTTENTAVIGSRTGSGNIAFQTYYAGSWGERMRIANDGNVGIGVTPSAWGSSYKSVQVNEAGGFAGKNDGLIVAQNCYFNGTNWVNNRASTFSSRYDMNVAGNGIHAWYVYNASFGTVGNTIPFTQAMTLDASGRLGIGTVSPNNTLTVRGSQDAGIEINSADSNMSRLIFAYDPANTRWYINSTLSGSGTTLPLTFLIQNSEVARFNTTGNLAFVTGKGIDFSAVTGGTGTATANVLNDYEEGTWTGTLTGTVANPTIPVTATGRYTKVGRQVTVQVYISNVVTTGASGRIGISGLPFANNGSTETIGAVGFYDIATFTGSPFAQIGFNATQVDLYSNISNSAYGTVTHNAGNARYLWFNMTYTVA